VFCDVIIEINGVDGLSGSQGCWVFGEGKENVEDEVLKRVLAGSLESRMQRRCHLNARR
jgi:hypothetical protein